MRFTGKPFNNDNLTANISGIIEILIPLDLWKRMKAIKTKNAHLTLTWISRYCLMRLLRHKGVEEKRKFQHLLAKDKSLSKARGNCHRHVMCFYGEDERRLQYISFAMRLGISVLVRVALLWYLPELEAGDIPDIPTFTEGSFYYYSKISWRKIRDFGTKIVKGWDDVRRDTDFMPRHFYHRAFLFERDEFW